MNNKESPIEKTDAPEDTQTTSDPNNNECETNEIPSTVQKSYSVGNEMDTEQDRKLFIGYGVNLLITEEVLQEFFKQFGDIERIIIKRDVMTSKPRGFAFITMAKSEQVWKVLNACPLQIKGRQIDVKLAKSRPISKKVFAEEAANQASESHKRISLNQECDVKKATPQSLAQQLKRNQQNLHHSLNSAGHSVGQSQNSNQFYETSTTSSLNYSKNYSKPLYQSQNSAKSGPSGNYRGAYNGKNQVNRNSHFNLNNGKRSVDSQYNTIHEYNGSTNNTNFNGRKNINQNSNQNRQYLSNSVPNGRRSVDSQYNKIHEYNGSANNTNFNGRKNINHTNQNLQYPSNSVSNVTGGNVNNSSKSFNPQLDKPQISLVNQQQQYCEQLVQQNYYGCQSMPFNDYYPAQPHFSQITTAVQPSNTSNNQYLAHQPNQNRQYLSNSVSNVTGANLNNSSKSFNQQPNKSQILLTNNHQPQQVYYELLAHNGYQSMPFNYYYTAQPHFNQLSTNGQQSANAATSQYLTYQPNHLYYYSHYAAQFYQAQPTQQTIQQCANSINPCYTNYQSANQIGSIDNNLHVQQPQQAPAAAEQVENNLINNFDEKYDGQDIANNYQHQLINNNLLNLPYQGSIQQC